MSQSSEGIQQTNYTLKNPFIKALLANFINKICDLLSAIDASSKQGLDAGCGEGHLIGRLRLRGAVKDVVGVDAGTDYLSFAAANYHAVDYLAADLVRLPFPDNTFDYILSTEVFEHLPDPNSALIELDRVAKKDAHLIISVPFEPFFHWGNITRGKYWNRGGYTPDHKNLWRRYGFQEFLSPVVRIENHFAFKTFPWMLWHCRFC